MTDPTAIDLEALEKRRKPLENYHGDLTIADVNDLIAAVEALRERVAEHDHLFDLAQKRERPWIEAWRKATGKHGTLPDYGEMLGWICDRAEIAETRVAELEAKK